MSRKFFLFFISCFLTLSCQLSAVNFLYGEDVVVSTKPAILEKAEAFEAGIERATFRFKEEFVLLPTQEKQTIKGKVYLDRKTHRTRVDYTGAVRAKVWLENDAIYFYDEELKQIIIRRWDEFLTFHLQAFLDFPILWDLKNFNKRFTLSEIQTSTGSLVQVLALPKPRGDADRPPYRLVLGFDAQSGQCQSLRLLMENYEAQVSVLDFNPKAKFKDKIFERIFPQDVAVLDMREGTIK